jgi:hypothetical protein
MGLAALAAVAGVFGCAKNEGPRTVPVTGTITLDSKPVDAATVTFVSTNKEIRPASGVTDASGKYTLVTAGGGAGAMVGSYKVTVSKIVGGAAAKPASQEEAMKRMQEEMKEGMAGMGKKPPEQKNELPEKYSSADESGLTAEVKDGAKNEFPFDLKSS